jgi:MFS family permease
MLFITEDLRIGPEVIGVVAALGGFGSLFGALLAERVTTRFGLGRVIVAATLVAAFGNLLIPLAPVGLPVVAIACLVGQQLIGDTAATVFEVTSTSLIQSRVEDRWLGRVNATVRVAEVVAQLAATLAGGLVAVAIGLRGAAFLAPLGALLAAGLLLASPVRSLRHTDATPPGPQA